MGEVRTKGWALKAVGTLSWVSGLMWMGGMFACASGRPPGPDEVCRNQSPRRLERYDTIGNPATVRPGANDTVIYTPPGGGAWTLRRCSQHYHCWIENLQPLCSGQHATEEGGPPTCPTLPPVGSWVEVHTVYSARDNINCISETLDCCTAGPIVVVGHHAKVTADTVAGPILVEWGPPSAEWTGSNTGPDNGQCKTTTARWSFTLGCGLEVSLGQLSLFTHPDPARGLQPPARLSRDLNFVPRP